MIDDLSYHECSLTIFIPHFLQEFFSLFNSHRFVLGRGYNNETKTPGGYSLHLAFHRQTQIKKKKKKNRINCFLKGIM